METHVEFGRSQKARTMDLRLNKNQLVMATVVLGMFGLATTTFLPDRVGDPSKSKDASAQADQSDVMYPTTPDSISKSLNNWCDPFEKIKSKLKFEKLLPESSPSILDTIRDQTGKDGKLLVFVKVLGGSDSYEGGESRRRHRHAVELALAVSGYSMRFPDRMTYVEGKYDYYHANSTHTQSEIDVPLKLYSNSTGNAVLVVWIRDEHLGHYPLHTIAQLCNRIIDAKNPVSNRKGLVICGPSSSNTLSRMAEEAESARNSEDGSLHKETIAFFKEWKFGTALFNSVCTASNTSLKPNQLFLEFRKDTKSPDSRETKDESVKIRLVHTIGVDSDLTKMLLAELELRGRSLDRLGSKKTVLFVEASSQKYIEGLKSEFEAKGNDLAVISYLRGVADTVSGENLITDYLDRTLADLRKNNPENVVAVGVLGSDDRDKLRIFEAARSVFPTAAFFTTELNSRFSEPKHLRTCRNLLVASHYGLRCDCKWVTNDMPSFRDGYQTSTYLATLIAIRCFDDTKQYFDDSNFFDGEGNIEQQDLFDICGRSDPNNKKALKPLLFEIGNSGPIQLSNDSLPSSFVIRQSSVRKSLTQSTSFLSVVLFGLIVVGITFVMRSFSNGLTKIHLDAYRMLQSVRDFFIETNNKLICLGKRLTQPSGDPVAPEPEITTGGRIADQDAFPIWFVCITVFTLFVLIVAWVSDYSVDGEKITFLESTSIWPSVAMFYLVIVLSSALVLRRWLEWSKCKTDTDLFTKGVLLAGLLFLGIFAALGFTWVDEPPARGAITRFTATIALWMAAVSLFLLASMSTISILKARKEISDQAKKIQEWDETDNSADPVLKIQNMLQQCGVYRRELARAMAIGESSSYTLMAPAALSIVLAVARLPLLDSWGTPQIWYAALMTPMLLSILAAFVMRSEARRFRYEVTSLIEKQQSDLLANSSNMESPAREKFNDCMQKLNQQIGLINRLDKGPYASVSSDPILGGVVLVITAGLTGPMRDVTAWLLHATTGISL